MAELIALTAEFMRMRDMVLFTMGTDMAARMAATAIAIKSSAMVKPANAAVVALVARNGDIMAPRVSVLVRRLERIVIGCKCVPHSKQDRVFDPVCCGKLKVCRAQTKVTAILLRLVTVPEVMKS